MGRRGGDGGLGKIEKRQGGGRKGREKGGVQGSDRASRELY